MALTDERALDDEFGDTPNDCGLAAMRAAYRDSGGMARGDDLDRLLEDQQPGDFVGLGRLIGAGEVFGFEWQREFWVPMFQFDLRDLSVKSGAQHVQAELVDELSGWALAAWFVRSSSWLGNRRPVDLLDSELAEVLGAARTDRFLLLG